MIAILYVIFVVLVLFGLTVFVHELGHYLVARWLGLVIDAFSIGFGPAIWKKKVGSTVYKIGCLPFGGYVALPQLEPGGGKETKNGENPDQPGEVPPRELPPVAPWKRILVAAAGAFGNLLFALLLAYIVFWIGKPSSPHERNTIVGYVEKESQAYELGLREGDTILAINEGTVDNWNDVLLTASLSTGSVEVLVENSEGAESSLVLATEENWMGVRAIPGIGWVNYCSVASVIPGSSAEEVGLKGGDLLTELDGIELHSREHLIDLVNERADREIPLKIIRKGEEMNLQVTPRFDESAGKVLIGIMFNTLDIDYDQVVHPRPLSQLRNHATAIFRFLRALVTPKEAKAASKAVGGPISILFMFWLTVQESIMVAIWFTGFVNVNLAILNLLPIPVLDGGHIMFAAWEAITRRPVSARVVAMITNVFIVLLILLFVTLSYRDVVRLIVPMFRSSDNTEVVSETNAPPLAE